MITLLMEESHGMKTEDETQSDDNYMISPLLGTELRYYRSHCINRFTDAVSEVEKDIKSDGFI